MSETCHEKCKFVLLALVVPSSELHDLPSLTTGAGFVAANVAHFDRHLTEEQQKKLQPALAIELILHIPTVHAKIVLQSHWDQCQWSSNSLLREIGIYGRRGTRSSGGRGGTNENGGRKKSTLQSTFRE